MRVINETGVISTYAGTGVNGDPQIEGSPAVQSAIRTPNALAFDSAGNLLIATNQVIYRVNAGGLIATLAGTGGVAGFRGDGGPPRSAVFKTMWGIAAGPNGDLYASDYHNHRVRRIGATVSTAVGASPVLGDGGAATQAQLTSPIGVSVDRQGAVYIAEQYNHRYRRVAPGGVISSLTGAAPVPANVVDGNPAIEANSDGPRASEPDNEGGFFFTNNGVRILRVDPQGRIRQFAGTGVAGFSGDGGPALSAQITNAIALKLDSRGNLLIAEGNRIRRVSASGVISRLAGATEGGSSGDGGQADLARFNLPSGLAFDTAGNLFVADRNNHRVRRISPDGIVTTVAGTGTGGFLGDGGPALLARLSGPSGVDFDSQGNLFIADFNNRRIRMVDRSGIITTVAGNGQQGAGGDGGPAGAAQFAEIFAIATDSADNIYVADRNNHRVRRLTPNLPSRIVITGGDGQSGRVRSVLDESLRVRVTGVNNIAVAGLAVRFTVISGAARLNPATAATTVDGTAATFVTLGETAGPVRIQATVERLEPVTFNLTAETAAAADRPVISTVVGAARSLPSVTALSPNGRIAILGSGFAPEGEPRQAGPDDLVEGGLPSRFAGVCVLVGDKRAGVARVAFGQIEAVLPAELPADAAVHVRVNCDEPSEVRSNTFTARVQSAAPEFLYFVNNPDGRNPVQAVDAESGRNIGQPGLVQGGDFAPAKPGGAVVLTVLGLGVVDAEGRPLNPVEVTIGGRLVPAADLLSITAKQGNPGRYEIRLRIPADAESGDQAITIRAGEFDSPVGAYLTVDAE